MLGLLGMLLINTRKISDLVKENIGFTVVLKENIKEADIRGLQKNLDATRYVKSTEYIDKDRAAKEWQQELGDDFINTCGYNPLLSTIEVKLYARYANSDSIAIIEKELQKYEQVSEVHYQKSLVHLVNENVRKISIIILIFSGLLFVIAISLINNTIRLSIYAKRFLINTMQLVGATSSFIRKPFIYRSIFNGIIGATIAILLLIIFLFWAEKQMQDIVVLTDFYSIFALCIALLFLGIVINTISTFFAVSKFLRLPTDDLYY
jgi:cell division transport system permease protein